MKTALPTLVLDCSFGGLALAVQKGEKLHARRVFESRASDALLPLLSDVLTEAGLKAADLARMVVTVGPGSFTGIRLGLAVAEGLKLTSPALDVQPVPTLPALARQVIASYKPDKPFSILLDAAGGQVYRQDFNARGKPLRVVRSEPLDNLKHLKKFVVAQTGLLAPFETHASVSLVEPETLLALADNHKHHLPLRPVYIKELTYQKVGA